MMNLIRESALYHLWMTLVSVYSSSALCRAIDSAGVWCNQQIDKSRLLAVLCREGYFARSWENSMLCKGLSTVVNLPIRFLQWLYQKLRPLLEGSFFVGLAVRMGQETAIMQALLILLLWSIPYQHWNNGYTLAGFLLLLGLFCIRGMHDRRATLDVTSLGVFPVLFFVMVFLAVPLSAFPSLSLRFLIYYGGAGLCVLLTVSSVRHLKDLIRLAAGGTGAMAVASLYAVYQRIQGVDLKGAYVDAALNPNMPGRVYSFYDNPNSFAVFLLMLIPISAALILCTRHWLVRLIACGTTLLGTVAMIMTYSRACWVGFAVAAIVFLFLWRPKLIPIIAVLCIVSFPILPASIGDRILSIFNFSDTSTSSRFPLYDIAIRTILVSPITGVGLGTAAPQQFMAQHMVYYGNHPYVHAHNLYLEVWLETGIIGLVTFLGGSLWNIKNAARQARRGAKSPAKFLGIGAASALCGSLVAGLADYPWGYPRVMTVFWFVFAMAIASVKICRMEEEETSGSPA